MPNALIFPDGIRLAEKEEIPGPEPARSKVWARVASAHIAPGYILHPSTDSRFTHYAEVNVDAPKIWTVFRDLCLSLLEPIATMVAGGPDDEPTPLGSANVNSLIAILEPHRYQLSHDGSIQHGLVSHHGSTINEVLVTPEKHFNVWMNNEKRFRQVMVQYDIREADDLEFLDQYPRTTVALPRQSVAFQNSRDLMRHVQEQLADIGE